MSAQMNLLAWAKSGWGRALTSVKDLFQSGNVDIEWRDPPTTSGSRIGRGPSTRQQQRTALKAKNRAKHKRACRA